MDKKPKDRLTRLDRVLVAQGDLDSYTHDHLVPAIRVQAFWESNLVVAQTLYRRRAPQGSR